MLEIEKNYGKILKKRPTESSVSFMKTTMSLFGTNRTERISKGRLILPCAIHSVGTILTP